MKTTTISILRQNIKAYIDGVIDTNEPVLVNKGADGAVIISLNEYNKLTNISEENFNRETASKINFNGPSKEERYIDFDINDL